MNTDIKLKEGYRLYFVTVFFEQDIHCVGYGFTNSIDTYVIAKDEANCDTLVREKYLNTKTSVKNVKCQLALKQDISNYVFYDRFAGFGEGCTHDEFHETLVKREEMKRLSDKGYNILVRASSNGNIETKTLIELAKEFRLAWGELGFWNKATQEIQRSCTQFLDQIISGEIDPIKEQERFYSLTGLFNQTYGEACNYSV